MSFRPGSLITGVTAISPDNGYSAAGNAVNWSGMSTPTPDKAATQDNDYGHMWTPASGLTSYIQFDLQTAQSVGEIYLWQYNQGGCPNRCIKTASIYYAATYPGHSAKSDPAGWTLYNPGNYPWPISTGNSPDHTVVDMTTAFTARYIEIDPHTAFPGTGQGNAEGGISEILFFGAPGAGSLPGGSPVTISSTGTLDLGGTIQQIASLSGGSGGKVINSGSGASTLTLNPASGSTTFGGVIGSGSGAISLVMSGSGTQVLLGINTYTGGTTVSGGALKLGQGGSMGSTAVGVTGTATYGTAYTTSGTAINGGVSLNLASGTTLDLTDTHYNTLQFTGGGTFSGATLEFDLGETAATSDKLTFGAASTVSGSNPISFSTLGNSLAVGIKAYTLIQGSGLSASNFTVPSTISISGVTYHLSLEADGSGLYLDVIAIGSPAKLAFTTQPGGGAHGAAWAQQPVVAVQDANGNTVTTDGSTVTVAILNNAGPGGTLSGTLTKVAVNGVADFSGNALKIDKAGTGYTLTATDDSLTAATSGGFNITGPIDHFDVTTVSTAFAGVPFDVTVTAKDGGGRTITTYAGTISFTSTDGAATKPGDYQFVSGDSGSHTFTGGVTLNTVGAWTITVTDGGVISTASSSIAVSVAPIVWTGNAGAPWTWNTTDLNWNGTGLNTLWDATQGQVNIANFNTSGATPNVSGTVYCKGITFNNTAWIVYNNQGDCITLKGDTPTITVDAGYRATIRPILSGSSGLVKNGDGTLSLYRSYGDLINDYTGGTIVNGGTLELYGPGNDSGACIRGALTINSGATVVGKNTMNGLFGGYPGKSIDVVTINGGTLDIDNGSSGNSDCSFTSVTMMGGLWKATSSSSFYDIFNNGLDWTASPLPITTLATDTTATISASISTRNAIKMLFTVADGAAAVDLLVSGRLTPAGSIAKAGPGVMVLAAADNTIGTTSVSGGTLVVNGSIKDGAVVTVASGATLGGIGSISGNVTYANGAFALFTHGAPLTLSGSLILNGNIVHLNLPSNLAAGTYILATYNTTGSSGSFAATPVIDSGSVVEGSYMTITTGSGNVSLIVSATPPATCAVTYDANGGTGTPAVQSKTQGVDLTLSIGGGMTRTGYAFIGWNTGNTGSGTAYAAGGIYTVDVAVKLYAQWTIAFIGDNDGNMVTVTANPEIGLYPASAMVDGSGMIGLGNGKVIKSSTVDPSISWTSEWLYGSSVGSPPYAPLPYDAIFTFSKNTSLKEIVIWNASTRINDGYSYATQRGAKTVTITCSTGAETSGEGMSLWSGELTQTSWPAGAGAPFDADIFFTEVPNVKAVKIHITSNWGGNYTGLSEVRFMGTPMKSGTVFIFK